MSDDYPVLEWTPDMVRRFWDWQSRSPETYFTYQFGRNIAAFLARYIKPGMKVLDYGCGVGHLLPHLCRASRGEVHGLDMSPQSVEASNARCAALPNFKGAFLADDAGRKNEQFDLIISVEVVEHLYDDVLAGMLADVYARLKPGGAAIFTTPNQEDLSRNMVMSPETGRLFHRWQHVRSWTPDGLAEMVSRAGFDKVETLETNLVRFQPPGLVPILKSMLKNILYPQPAKPHLVCIAHRAV